MIDQRGSNVPAGICGISKRFKGGSPSGGTSSAPAGLGTVLVAGQTRERANSLEWSLHS